MNKLNFFKYTFAVGITATMLFGCSEAEQLMNEMPDPDMQEAEAAAHTLTRLESVALAVQQKGTYKISEGEAVQSLERYAKSISGNEEATVRVKSSVLKKSPETGKELYYEVVFESEKGTGFSILSADERADELLCYSEVGAIADTSFNKSLKFCLELVDRYVEEQTRAELDIETLASSAQEKLISAQADRPVTKAIPPFSPNNPGPWVLDRLEQQTTVDERLKYIKGGWHQEDPYNALLPYIPGTTQRAYVGCTMVAVAHIMSYHKKPFSNYITTGDWSTMINHTSYNNGLSLLQNLMEDLFHDMYTSYTTSGTESNITKARNFLSRNGYTVGGASNYSYTDVWNALAYGPTYVRGTDSNNGGHAWVVDAAQTTTTRLVEIYTYNHNGTIIETTNPLYTNINQMVRYDWGWGYSTQNTWYDSDVFQPKYDPNNFNSNIQIISSIR